MHRKRTRIDGPRQVGKSKRIQQVTDGIGAAAPGQVLTYTGMLGRLQNAGTTTLAHYLDQPG